MTVVAITGGTGFVGAAVATGFVMHGGFDIRILSRGPRASAIDAQVIVGDLDDEGSCERLVAGADVVVHAAGLVRSRDTAALERTNVDGTRSLLKATRLAGVRRVVHLSSTGVYGSPGRLVNEASPRRPMNPYERSKAVSEALVLGARYDDEVVVIQPSNVIGVGSPNRPLRRFLQRMADGRAVVHAGAWSNYVSVGGLANVVVKAATVGAVPRVLIVNAPMPLDELTSLAAKTVGRRGRSVLLPGFIGQALTPVLAVGAAHLTSLERARALVDQTRFVTSHQGWFDRHQLDLDLGSVLADMAADYRITPAQ